MADQVINFPRDTTLKHANEIQRAIAAGCATPGTADLCYKHLVAQATTKDEVDSLFIEWWKAQYDSSKYSKVQMLERWFGNVLDDDRVHGCTVPLYATSTSAIGELTDASSALRLPHPLRAATTSRTCPSSGALRSLPRKRKTAATKSSTSSTSTISMMFVLASTCAGCCRRTPLSANGGLTATSTSR